MIVHEASKRIVLRPAETSALTTVLPTAKVFEHHGQQLVAVPHAVNETRVLRNLGYDVPSPIRHHYDWPGRYKPFAAQQATSEFMTLNPRAFVLNDMGCVDADTEYLSPTGWVRIADYVEGPVAQYHPPTGEISFVTGNYVKLPCTDMLHIKTKYGVDQLLSPEHRVLLETRDGSRQEVLSADDLYLRQQEWRARKSRKQVGTIGWCRAAVPVTFKAPGAGGVGLSIHDIRLQVAVIADGYFPRPTARCTIRIKKVRKIERIQALLRAAGREFTISPCKPEGFVRVSFDAPMRTKEFDASWWAATPAQLKVVADEVMHWDGSVSPNKPSCRFSTLSEQSANFVQYVFAGTGRTARVMGTLRRGKVEYNVQVRADGKPLMLCGSSSSGERHGNIAPAISTDGYKYCFTVPSTFLLFRRNGCIFASGNTGKTLASLWAYDFLRKQGVVRQLLVVSPLSTLERTWADEVFSNFPHLTVAVLHGTKERRQKLIAQGADIYVINHDGVFTVKDELLKLPELDAVIVDEVAAFRTAGTRRWKALAAICKDKEWVWGMTGTPTPNSPVDAWGQCRLIVPGRVSPYLSAFRDAVQVRNGPYAWVNRSTAVETVSRAMQPAIRFSRAECVDLPDVIHNTRHVPMSPEQTSAYKDMLRKLVMESDGQEALAVNEAVKVSKMLQIACGVVYGNDGEEIALANATARVSEVLDIIEQAGGKVIVFVPFKSVLRVVAEQLSKTHSVGVISGDTSLNKRREVFTSFQSDLKTNPAGLRVLVAQPAAMSHGLTLTAANTIVWYGPTYSNEIYEQANARISRPGQKLQQFIVHIEGSDIERRVYTRLGNKQKLQGLLLETVKGA
jgi:superfamily II DNA or RNA helicase